VAAGVGWCGTFTITTDEHRSKQMDPLSSAFICGERKSNIVALVQASGTERGWIMVHLREIEENL